MTVLFVTHDREEAFSLADRIALMRDGTVVQTGSPEELYLQPADRWAAEFVGAANFVPGTIDGGLVDTLLGRFPVANLNGSTNVEALIPPSSSSSRSTRPGSARWSAASSAAMTSSTACGSPTARR